MKKLTFMFFPLETGLAHIARSLAVAEELKNRGHIIHFLLPKRKQQVFASSSIEFVTVPDIRDYDSLDTFDDFSNIDSLEKLMREEIKLIQKYKPDYAIVDFRLSALGSCSYMKIPFSFVVGSAGLPVWVHIPSLGWPKAIEMLWLPFISYFVILYKKNFVKDIAKALERITSEGSVYEDYYSSQFIVPEVKGYMPSDGRKIRISHVNHIVWDGFRNALQTKYRKADPSKKTIYLTFGGTGFDRDKLVKIATELAKRSYNVIVAAGTIASEVDFPTLPNLYVEKYVNFQMIASEIDLVISHGGYGTIIEALHHKIPTLSLPYNPDQVVHGLRFQELGYGKCMHGFSLRSLFTTRGLLDWQLFQHRGESLKVSDVIQNVEEMMGNLDVYKKNMASYTGDENGASSAADAIEKDALSRISMK